MGDMADDAMDQALDELINPDNPNYVEAQWEFWNGQFIKECGYCGAKRLRWQKTDKGWRLHDKKNLMHTCQAFWKDKGKDE